MSEQFFILLGLVIVAHVLVTPIVLLVLVVRARRRIRWLEEEVEFVGGELDGLRKRMAPAVEPPAQAAAAAEPEPVAVRPAPAPEPGPAVATAPILPPVPPPVAVREPEPFPEFQPAAEHGAPSIGFQVSDFLRGIGMWPPERAEGQSREALLMQWWLPRVGGLLALLSALFFGVYINQSTSPLFKCLELVAVSLGIAGLGRTLERRYARFGGVLLVTGLIMLYLTSVAAYVLPATRVIENPLYGSLLQAAVLAGICGVGFLRRSAGIVLLAFHFGYFLSVFMAWEGLREGALIAGGLLFVAGVTMARIGAFRALNWIVVPGTFLVALAFPAIRLFRETGLPGNIPVQVYLNAAVAGVVAQYFFNVLGNQLRARVLVSAATSLAVAAVFCYYRVILPDTLQWAALALGCTLLTGALAAWLLRGSGFLFQLLFIKASFLIGAWAILHYAGDLRWMVLGLETVVVAAAARRARVAAVELAVWAVAAASLFYYAGALSGTLPATQSFTWWMMAAYPGVLLLAFAHLLTGSAAADGMPGRDPRTIAYAAVPVVAMVAWHHLFTGSAGRTFELPLPFLVVTYAAVALSFAPFLCRWLLLAAAALAYVLASVLYCMAPFSLVLLLLIVAAGVTAVLWLTGRDEQSARLAENAVYVLARVPVLLWLLQVMNDWPGQVVLMPLAGVALLLSGYIPRLRDTSAWFFLPMVVLFLTENADKAATWWNIAGLASGLLCLLLPAVVPSIGRNLGWGRKWRLWSYIGGVLLWLHALRYVCISSPWLTEQVAFAATALVLLVSAWRWRIPGYFVSALLFIAFVAYQHFLSVSGEAGVYYPWSSEALLSAGLLYLFALVWFFLKPDPFRIQSPGNKRQFALFSSGLGAILLFNTSVVTFRYTEIGWQSWYTPLLALTAFLMIFLGLFRRDVAYRYLGLLALLVPLARLFVVDVRDTLHRIIAFAAAAVVLTVLGYLYHRLSTSQSAPEEGDQ